MKPISAQTLFASCVFAVVLVLQVAPSLAGAPDARLRLMQGSKFPGLPVSSTETARNTHHGPVDLTFTKWITTFPLMEGFTGGDVHGRFLGEVLQRQVSRDLRVIRLEAVYEVQAGDHSFTALIRGGTGETKSGEPASVNGAAVLDGVILTGWRTGARVHVTFQTLTNCPGAPDARTCFQGAIHVEKTPEE